MRYVTLLIGSCMLFIHAAYAVSPVGVTVDNSLPATGASGEAQTVGYTFTNNLPFAITNASISGSIPSSGYTVDTNNCSTIAAGGSCTYEATFTPEDTGIYTVALKFNYAGRQLQLTPQTMTATSSSSSTNPSLTLLSTGASVLSYRRTSGGTATGPATGALNIQNTGAGTLSNISVNDPSGTQGLTIGPNNCTTLTAGNSCSVTLTYAPSADPGPGTVNPNATILSVSAVGSDSQQYQGYYHLSLYNAGAQAALEFPNQLNDYSQIPPYGFIESVIGNGSGKLIAMKGRLGVGGNTLYISTDNGASWRPVANVTGPINSVKSVAMDSDIIFYTTTGDAANVHILNNGEDTTIAIGADVNRLKRIGENVYALTDNGVYEVSENGAASVGNLPANTNVTDITLLDGVLYASNDQSGIVFNVSTGQSLASAPSIIQAIAAFNNQLYAAVFNDGVYRWNGTGWDQVLPAGGPDNTPISLMATNSHIYAGFSQSTTDINPDLFSVYSSQTGDSGNWTATGQGDSGYATNLGATFNLIDSDGEIFANTGLGLFRYDANADIWVNLFGLIPNDNQASDHELKSDSFGNILMSTAYGAVLFEPTDLRWQYVGGAFGGTSDSSKIHKVAFTDNSDIYVSRSTGPDTENGIYRYSPATGWSDINGGDCSANNIASMQSRVDNLYVVRLGCADGSIYAYNAGADNWLEVGNSRIGATSGKLSLDTNSSQVMGLVSDGANATAYTITDPITVTDNDAAPFVGQTAVYGLTPTPATIDGAIAIGSPRTIYFTVADATGVAIGTAVGDTPGSAITAYDTDSVSKLFVYDRGDDTIKVADNSLTTYNDLITGLAVNSGVDLVHYSTDQLLQMIQTASPETNFYLRSFLDN